MYDFIYIESQKQTNKQKHPPKTPNDELNGNELIDTEDRFPKGKSVGRWGQTRPREAPAG